MVVMALLTETQQRNDPTCPKITLHSPGVSNSFFRLLFAEPNCSHISSLTSFHKFKFNLIEWTTLTRFTEISRRPQLNCNQFAVAVNRRGVMLPNYIYEYLDCCIGIFWTDLHAEHLWSLLPYPLLDQLTYTNCTCLGNS